MVWHALQPRGVDVALDLGQLLLVLDVGHLLVDALQDLAGPVHAPLDHRRLGRGRGGDDLGGRAAAVLGDRLRLLLLQGGLLGQLLEEQRVLPQPLVLDGEDGLVEGFGLSRVVIRIQARFR